jgi:hypothetical protein
MRLPGEAGGTVAVRRTLASTICRIADPTQVPRPRQLRDVSTVNAVPTRALECDQPSFQRPRLPPCPAWAGDRYGGDDILELLGEFGVVGELERVHPMRLQPVPLPDTPHLGRADPQHLGHCRRRPMGRVVRRRLAGQGSDAIDGRDRQGRDARGPRRRILPRRGTHWIIAAYRATIETRSRPARWLFAGGLWKLEQTCRGSSRITRLSAIARVPQW